LGGALAKSGVMLFQGIPRQAQDDRLLRHPLFFRSSVPPPIKTPVFFYKDNCLLLQRQLSSSTKTAVFFYKDNCLLPQRQLSSSLITNHEFPPANRYSLGDIFITLKNFSSSSQKNAHSPVRLYCKFAAIIQHYTVNGKSAQFTQQERIKLSLALEDISRMAHETFIPHFCLCFLQITVVG